MASSIRCRSRDDRGGDLLLVPAVLTDARPRDLAAPRVALRHEGRAALRARLGHRAGPERELASRVVAAREEGLAPPRPPLHELSSASRLGTGDAERDRLGGLAVRIARARDELPEAPVLDHHRLAAGRADLVGRLVGGLLAAAAQILRVLALGVRRAGQEAAEPAELLDDGLAALRAGLAGLLTDLDVFHLPAGRLEIARELLVERVDGRNPVGVALLDLVEGLLELGRELDVHHLGKVRDEQIVDLHAQLGREERPALAMDVAAILDGREDLGVRRRPPDAA